MKALQKHPNTMVALGTSLGLGTLVVQVGAHFGLTLSGQEGIYIAGGLATVALFIGRNGAVGTYRFVKKVVLYGTGSSDKPSRARGHRRG